MLGWLSVAVALAVVVIIYKWLNSQQVDLTSHSRYVLITGCDSGFGQLAAKRLDALGCHVIAGCLTERGEDELKKSCSNRLLTLHLDVTKHDTVTKALDTVVNHLPPNKGLWGLVNNAGIASPKRGPVEWLTLQQYHDVMAVNSWGLIDVTVTFLPLIRKEAGRVVNVASIAGRVAFPCAAPYAISKYTVEAFSDCLRREMRRFGVSVHIIEPGFHNTALIDSAACAAANQAAWEQATPLVKQAYGENFLHAMQARTKLSQSKSSSNLSDVIDAFQHALLSCRPHVRYPVGRDALFFYVPLSLLPGSLADWLLRVTS